MPRVRNVRSGSGEDSGTYAVWDLGGEGVSAVSYTLRLTCEHYVEASVLEDRVAPEAFCPICKDWHLVMDYTRDEWHTRCNQCPMGRSHGMARSYAEQAAKRHEARYAGHHVSVQFYDVGKKNRPPREEPFWKAALLPGFEPPPPPF